MKVDILIFVSVLTALTAVLFAKTPLPQSLPQSIQQPISEKVALLARDFEYVSRDFKELKKELKEELTEIKQLLEVRNSQDEKWIIIVLGLLVTGDRGWTIFQRSRQNQNKGVKK